MDVRYGDPQGHGSRNGGENFETVPKDQQHVRFVGSEDLGEAEDSQPDGFRRSYARVRGKKRLYLSADGKAVCLYLPHGEPELRRQVGSGDQKIQAQVGRILNGAERPVEQPILCP